MTSTEATPPVVCNLTIGQRKQQELEWADLAGHSISGREIDGGAESTFPQAMADQIEDLVARELVCCGSWLQITLEQTDHASRLRVTTTNAEGVALIRSMAGL